MNIRTEIEIRNIMEKINKTKSYFFKIHKIDQSLAEQVNIQHQK